MSVTVATSKPPVYDRNNDYSKPRGKETFLYGVFYLDPKERPYKTQIGISSFGFVYVMEWSGVNKYRFTALLLQPHELDRFNEVLHSLMPTMSKSRSRSPNELALLGGHVVYSQPSLSNVSVVSYAHDQKETEPLAKELRAWQAKAKAIWDTERQPGKGEKVIATLETKHPEYLFNMMNTLHNVHTWKVRTKREQADGGSRDNGKD